MKNRRSEKQKTQRAYFSKPISARISLPSACAALKSKFRHFNKTSIEQSRLESRRHSRRRCRRRSRRSLVARNNRRGAFGVGQNEIPRRLLLLFAESPTVIFRGICITCSPRRIDYDYGDVTGGNPTFFAGFMKEKLSQPGSRRGNAGKRGARRAARTD